MGGGNDTRDGGARTVRSLADIPDEIVRLAIAYPGPYRPSLAIAQWALETGWGTSELCRKHNNWCGLKPSKSDSLRRYEAGSVEIGRVTYARYRSLEDCARDRADTLESYNARDVSHAMMRWCPRPGYYEDLQMIRRPWAMKVDARALKQEIGMDELRRVLYAMTGWATSPYSWVVELILAIPQWVHEAERQDGMTGPEKRTYVSSRVYESIDLALNIPWYLDGTFRGWTDTLVSWVVEKMNVTFGKEWGDNEIPFSKVELTLEPSSTAD